MELLTTLSISIIILLVLLATLYSRQTSSDKARSIQIDKALYIEIRRASRLSLQCDMNVAELTRLHKTTQHELERLRSELQQLRNDLGCLMDCDEGDEGSGDLSPHQSLARMIVQQQQILKRLEMLKHIVDNGDEGRTMTDDN